MPGTGMLDVDREQSLACQSPDFAHKYIRD